MKQYGRKSDFVTTAWLERHGFNLYGSGRRAARRMINQSAKKWWEQQTDTTGLPHLFHCGGVE